MEEAIILAGGLGTRLREVVQDIPKCMVDIKGKPFLEYLLNNLIEQKIRKVILSVGYKSGVIQDYFQYRYQSLDIDYAIEQEPLGTGGAILWAMKKTQGQNVVILNGDTFFKVNIDSLLQQHLNQKADLTVALKPMEHTERYGTVEIDSNNRIIGFKEKQAKHAGFINGGVYISSLSLFDGLDMKQQFSFEKDFLEKYIGQKKLLGIPAEEYFIDIGIPADYERAKKELAEFIS